MKTQTFANREALRNWAHALVPLFDRPALVLLNGEMGAGKTQTVRWFLEALGFDGAASPTFAIHHEYVRAGSPPVDHVDLYRVTSDQDLDASGFWDLLQNPQGLVFIEWADRLPREVWPSTHTRIFIEIEKGEDEAREVRWEVIRP